MYVVSIKTFNKQEVLSNFHANNTYYFIFIFLITYLTTNCLL